MSLTDALRRRAQAFLEGDPDPASCAELAALLGRAEVDAAALKDLEDRFSGPLEFGTAGMRGLLGAGETRMNRAVVICATAGLLDALLQALPDAASRGLVIARDGRAMSAEFQEEAARVAAARGVAVHWLEGPTPTPVAAFAVRSLGAAAGVMVTASHNPKAYNGYKVYWENGAQIVPPWDHAIAAGIARQPSAVEVPRVGLEAARAAGLLRPASGVLERYLEAVGALQFAPDAPVRSLRIAYSAMHGVGEPVFREAMRRRGFVEVASVQAQAEPDPSFPTVAFPNPEEPGALDLVLELARREDADLVLVNDPDADRLGAAVRHPRGAESAWVVLGGNEIGALLAEHILAHDAAPSADRLVMTTIVSSQLLRRMAERHGVHYEETLTGFKWIANRAIALGAQRGWRFVFGFEEALGYTVGTVVRDKDGISAAQVLAESAALLAASGRTLIDALAEIRRKYGYFATRQRSLTLPGREGSARIRSAMAHLRAAGAAARLGPGVQSCWDLAASRRTFADGTVEEVPEMEGDVLIFELSDGGRVAVRPSGTEPKIKLYFEVVEVLGPSEAMSAAEARASQRLADLERATLALAQLGP